MSVKDYNELLKRGVELLHSAENDSAITALHSYRDVTLVTQKGVDLQDLYDRRYPGIRPEEATKKFVALGKTIWFKIADERLDIAEKNGENSVFCYSQASDAIKESGATIQEFYQKRHPGIAAERAEEKFKKLGEDIWLKAAQRYLYSAETENNINAYHAVAVALKNAGATLQGLYDDRQPGISLEDATKKFEAIEKNLKDANPGKEIQTTKELLAAKKITHEIG